MPLVATNQASGKRRKKLMEDNTNSPPKSNLLNLHLSHLQDLRNSGLNDDTIALMRVESVEPSDRLKAKGVISAYRMPYLQLKDCSDFYRDRLTPAIIDDKGRQQKYDQPPGVGCRLYVLEPVVDLLQDYRKPLFVVEGEK